MPAAQLAAVQAELLLLTVLLLMLLPLLLLLLSLPVLLLQLQFGFIKSDSAVGILQAAWSALPKALLTTQTLNTE